MNVISCCEYSFFKTQIHAYKLFTQVKQKDRLYVNVPTWPQRVNTYKPIPSSVHSSCENKRTYCEQKRKNVSLERISAGM